MAARGATSGLQVRGRGAPGLAVAAVRSLAVRGRRWRRCRWLARPGQCGGHLPANQHADQLGVPAGPVGGQGGGGQQAQQPGQGDRARRADPLRDRPAGQDAEALRGQQAGLGDRERAHPPGGGQGRDERGGGRQLVGAARTSQGQEQDQDR